LLGRKLAVGGKSAQIEKRRIESGIFPVNEPKPLSIIDEVCRKQIVVTEHNVDRSHGGFETRGPREKVRKNGRVPAIPFAQRVPIVAHDMEHPEHRGGPAQILRNVPVTASHHVDQPPKVVRVAAMCVLR
jgi:hypothetical protein